MLALSGFEPLTLHLQWSDFPINLQSLLRSMFNLTFFPGPPAAAASGNRTTDRLQVKIVLLIKLFGPRYRFRWTRTTIYRATTGCSAFEL